MIRLTPEFKTRAVSLGWMAGFFCAGLLLWSLTQPLQVDYLLRAVNRILISREDSRRLAAPLGRRPVMISPMGVWYSMLDTESGMFVFVFMWDGVLIPCGALVSGEGKVEELLPLSGSARQLVDRIPQGIIGVYVRRIEAAAPGRNGL
jgi:hypothetical protein